MLRKTPFKKSASVLKKTPLRKVSLKKIERNQGQVGERWNEDREFYMKIWKNRRHVCYETGEYLGSQPLSYHFHHILEKEESRFPQYRHCDWNIILVSLTVHDQIGMDIDKTPKVKKLTLELLQKHNNGEL